MFKNDYFRFKALRESEAGVWGEVPPRGGGIVKKSVNLKNIAIKIVLSLSDQKMCADSESKKSATLILSQI